MILKSLFLRNFRSYEEKEFSFSPGLNLFIGQNGIGKTNLLEAILFLSTGRSFRTPHLTDLIRHGETFFYIEAELVEEKTIHHRLLITFDGIAKKLTYNNTQYGSFTPLLGLLPSVLYAPSDSELITSPTSRRRFLNLPLVQADPLYVHHLSRYTRALKQRNALLKSKDPQGIEPFEQELAHSAAFLIAKRAAWIASLSVSSYLAKLTHEKESASAFYHPSSDPATYRALLEKNRRRELLFGSTLAGPHRDDVALEINGRSAKLYASEGQKKTLIAALRLAEWELLSQSKRAPALLAIDDLGLHLDPVRQEHLEALLPTFGQVFVTSPRPLLSSLL